MPHNSVDILFCRELLSAIHPAVKKHGYAIVKDAWVWCAGRDHWEFHGPDDYFWHGNAGNAYEARYKGWAAFLAKKGFDVNGEKLPVEEMETQT